MPSDVWKVLVMKPLGDRVVVPQLWGYENALRECQWVDEGMSERAYTAASTNESTSI